MNIKTIGQIIEGHGNNVLDKAGLLPDDMQALATRRLGTCQQCDKYTLRSTCSMCGCFMPAKTKSLRATCPQGKWK